MVQWSKILNNMPEHHVYISMDQVMGCFMKQWAQSKKLNAGIAHFRRCGPGHPDHS